MMSGRWLASLLLALSVVAPTAFGGRPEPWRPAEQLTVLPEDGRGLYLTAFASAQSEIRIEICVLEDPEILSGLNQALLRGVRVRALVDQGKYAALAAERANLASYLVAAGGELHLSNPIFPRSFPKVILIDHRQVIIGSACLDSTTFAQYRDYAYATTAHEIVTTMAALFENDWRYSAPPGEQRPDLQPDAAQFRA